MCAPTNLVCTRSQEKEAVSSEETEPDLPVSVQESLAEAWVSGLLQGQGLWAQLITELTQDWGNRLLEGTNKTVCAPGPRRKEQ